MYMLLASVHRTVMNVFRGIENLKFTGTIEGL
jgi:hypothetical protein